MSVDVSEHTENILGIVLDEFPLDVASTRRVEAEFLGRETRVFEVDPKKSPLIPGEVDVGRPYIIDTVSGMEIACHPHVVGKSLEMLCLDCATEFRRTLSCSNLVDFEESIVLNILRGGSGYMVAEAIPGDVPIVNVRTEYREGGYRSHTDDSRSIAVTFSDYPERRLGSDASTLLIPDTFATGRSSEAALNELFASGLEPRKIVIYGFIAIPALVRLGMVCSGRGIELLSFSICDVAPLAHNNYDMPLYGFDEGLYSSTGELRRLGSIVDVETLQRFMPRYIAGLDQPGDWSERQDRLFGGYGDERGDIVGHLRRSLRLIESLRGINSGQPWYNDFHDGIALRELGRLGETILEYE